MKCLLSLILVSLSFNAFAVIGDEVCKNAPNYIQCYQEEYGKIAKQRKERNELLRQQKLEMQKQQAYQQQSQQQQLVQQQYNERRRAQLAKENADIQAYKNRQLNGYGYVTSDEAYAEGAAREQADAQVKGAMQAQKREAQLQRQQQAQSRRGTHCTAVNLGSVTTMNCY